MIVNFLCHVCRTPLGKIDTETLHLPYTPDQFKPIAPGANPPYPDILSDWTHWWCPQCNNRPMLTDKVLTEQGWVDARPEEDGLITAMGQKMVGIMKDHYQEQNEAIKGLTCPACGKLCGSKIGLISHMRHCKK